MREMTAACLVVTTFRLSLRVGVISPPCTLRQGDGEAKGERGGSKAKYHEKEEQHYRRCQCERHGHAISYR